MRAFALVVVGLLIAAGCLVVVGGCHDWQHNKTVDGINYSRVREETVQSDKLTIGQLQEPVEVDGCTYNGWLHRRENGSISGGMIAVSTVINGITVPADTWVAFDEEKYLSACHFPKNQIIQGHEVRGTGGGVKGATVKFYPSGKLRLFFAPKDATIQEVPCKGGLFDFIELHESGRLKKCTLAEARKFDDQQLPKGASVEFDENGRMVAE